MRDEPVDPLDQRMYTVLFDKLENYMPQDDLENLHKEAMAVVNEARKEGYRDGTSDEALAHYYREMQLTPVFLAWEASRNSGDLFTRSKIDVQLYNALRKYLFQVSEGVEVKGYNGHAGAGEDAPLDEESM